GIKVGDVVVRNVLAALVMIFIAMMLTTVAFGNDTASHSVTIHILHISKVAVVGGDISLQLSLPSTGSGTNVAVNETCGLLWTTNLTDTKITVEADSDGIHTALRVEAIDVVGGEAVGEAILSSDPVVLINGISQSIGGCGLRYTATIASGDWEGSETFTVTYTILASN
ncbi:hypothetical protein KAR02_11035, partial [Candidatus Bipolaricaulota bacterium]|nr:hypothetical protein [Candidatus Bipolaricaulota bacterium]